jgi:hypothetical protein
MSKIPGAGWTSGSYFQMAPQKTMAVPMSIHKLSRSKLCDVMESEKVGYGVILLQGGNEISICDTDMEYLFR